MVRDAPALGTGPAVFEGGDEHARLEFKARIRLLAR